MVTLDMDPHPASHTVAALDSNGPLLGSIKMLNTSAGLATAPVRGCICLSPLGN